MTEAPEDLDANSGLAAFALIYLTFFLDNVLLTVLVPIIPDWVRGGPALALWSQHAPIAAMLNSTVRHLADDAGAGVEASGAGAGAGAGGGVGRAQATVGAVLGAKAAAQLAAAGPAAAAVCRLGPARVLHAATAMLAAAAAVLWACGQGGGGWAVWAVGGARALHGAGAAGAGVAGLALAAALPPPLRDRALPALLGAVALGVLVGYPAGGAAAAWRPGAPFLLLAAALMADLGLQHIVLDKHQYNMPAARGGGGAAGARGAVWREARGAAGACAGCVLLSTCVMAALEPLLPLWLVERFGVSSWAGGVAFLPDSGGYLLAATCLGACARRLGPERVAIAGQVVVGVGAVAAGRAGAAWALAGPQAALGAGLGAVDAALVPALLARAAPRRAAARAALLQMASSAAYAVGPAAGGAAAWAAGVPAALTALGLANLLYAAWLHRVLATNPLSNQWGGCSPGDGDSDEDTELAPRQYARLS